jgi:hypothetical protein
MFQRGHILRLQAKCYQCKNDRIVSVIEDGKPPLMSGKSVFLCQEVARLLVKLDMRYVLTARPIFPNWGGYVMLTSHTNTYRLAVHNEIDCLACTYSPVVITRIMWDSISSAPDQAMRSRTEKTEVGKAARCKV